MYKVSFIDNNGDEFMGTIEHYSTDGRYNLNTITEEAREEARKHLKCDSIAGFNLRRHRFSNPIIATVLFSL